MPDVNGTRVGRKDGRIEAGDEAKVSKIFQALLFPQPQRAWRQKELEGHLTTRGPDQRHYSTRLLAPRSSNGYFYD